MTDTIGKKNDATVTVTFAVAGQPVPAQDMADFIRDLTELARVLSEELVFPEKDQPSADNSGTDPASGGGGPSGPAL